MSLELYDKVRDQMKTGDVLLWHHNSLIGKWIQAKTKSSFNHASMVIRLQEYEGADSRRWTQEAVVPHVTLTFLSRALPVYNGDVWWFPLKDEWEEKRRDIGTRALDLVGIPYDEWGLVKQLFGRTFIELRRLFCSEDVAYCLGYDKGIAPWPGEIAKLGIYKESIKIYSSEVQYV